VKVYAGTDPLTGREIRFRKTCKTEQAARIELGRLLAQAAAGPLGLDRIYVQAKRYAAERAVGRSEIQEFVGALHGARADRGIFITTSRFTPEAVTYADRVAARVILLDGLALSGLMVRYNIGVQDQQTYVIKHADEDFFGRELIDKAQ